MLHCFRRGWPTTSLRGVTPKSILSHNPLPKIETPSFQNTWEYKDKIENGIFFNEQSKAKNQLRLYVQKYEVITFIV